MQVHISAFVCTCMCTGVCVMLSVYVNHMCVCKYVGVTMCVPVGICFSISVLCVLLCKIVCL